MNHSPSPTIAGPGLSESSMGTEVHAQLDRRVSNMENWAESLSGSIERVETEARDGQVRLERKLDDQTALLASKIDNMATRQMSLGRPNWGVIASWVGLGAALVSAIGLAYTRPLDGASASHERRLDKLEERERADFERGIRNEERVNFLRGVKGTP